MTSRRRRFLASLPIVALAPLLAAPRGCHFGNGKVPLGQNATGGDAGMGGDDGTSGSGGSATGGHAGTAGTATGGTAGTATGGTAGSGGGQSSGPCLETLSPFDWGNTHGLEFNIDDVHRLLGDDHDAALTWEARPAAELTFALVGVRVYYVESEPNPDFPLDIEVSCEDHVRAIGVARVSSSDGALDETLPNFALSIAIPTLDGPGGAGDRIFAVGAATIAADRVRGSYAPAIPPTQCFHALQFNVTIRRDGFDGSLIETISGVPCGVNEPDSAVVGREAAQFLCTGDCRTAPKDAVAIEAESCDGLGLQLTHAGDEATFTRSDANLEREEFWGCGCARYSEFVMAWSPSSPLELRLCHDDGADPCEAACSGPISHDLTTAFRAAGTSDFRFAD